MSGLGDSLVLTCSSPSAMTAIRYLNINLSYSTPGVIIGPEVLSLQGGPHSHY